MGFVESDGRFFVHADLYSPESPDTIRHYKEVLQNLDTALKERGLDTYYTLADCLQTYRYNKLMGFESNYEVWNDEYEVMKRRI